MEAPKHLSHKPHIVVNDYETHDGMYKPSIKTTDARALSIGEAQYDPSHFSAKVFRQVGDRWSRQSEELPLHRVLDLTILILASKLRTNLTASVSMLNEKDVSQDELKELTDYYNTHKGVIDPKLDEIKKLINILIP